MAEIAPKQALAAFTREQVDGYDEWDTSPAFMTLHNIDGELKAGMYAVLDVPPEQLPSVISRMTIDFLRRQDDPASDAAKLPPPCAYLLQIEAFMAKIATDAPKAEHEQLDRDGQARKIHARPDAIEIANAVCADVHGRLYSAIARRDTGEITESFHAPLDDKSRLSGRFADVLLAIAHMTGMTHWGLPGPIPMSN